MNLVGTKHTGYTIIKQGKKAVIGISESPISTTYVAWTYSIQDGKPEFGWGRYSSTEKTALQAFEKKEKGVYSG